MVKKIKKKKKAVAKVVTNKAKKTSNFDKIGKKIGHLVTEKNKAYGDSFTTCGEFLKLLYPDGISPEQYTDALCLVRIFDKMKRIATDKNYGNEEPYTDLVGYGILGVDKEMKRKKQEK